MSIKGIGYKILHFPLTRIFIGIAVVTTVYAAGQFYLNELFKQISITEWLRDLIIGVVSAFPVVAVYIILFRSYEKRKITELSIKGIGKHLGPGILLGVVLQSLTILVIYLSGGFTVVSVNSILLVVPALTLSFSAAIFEEVFFRGIIFRITEEKLGSYLALLISALIFGALHLANPNSSLVVAIGLAIQAGLLLAVAYIYTRNLWSPIAIHFAWNFTQAGIFGAAVSGNALEESLLTTRIEGASWITGGSFGPEGSIQATLLCLVPTVVLLILSRRQNKLINPYWRKR